PHRARLVHRQRAQAGRRSAVDRPRRLLHIVQRYAPYEGGSENYMRELSERFAADGHAVTVLTTDAWDLEYFWNPAARRVNAPPDETLNGARVLRFPVRHYPASSLGYRVLRRAMAEGSRLPRVPGGEAILRRGGRFAPWAPALHAWARRHATEFDLVHAANISIESTVIAGAGTARRGGVPFVVTPFVHLGSPGDARIVRYYSMPHQVRLLRDADATIVQTEQERTFLTARGVPDARLHRIGVGVHLRDVTGGDAERARRAFDLRGPIVYFSGTAAADKGTYDLIAAMRRIWDEGRDATLVLTGPMLSDVRAFFDAMSAEERARIRPLGFVTKQTQANVLAATDVLALPSRTDSFGIVFLDAWANGIPVIGANAGGIPGVVSDGIDGLLVPFGDVAALAGALRRLLDDPALRQRMGEAGRAKVLARYTWETIVASVAHLYDTLLRV
ncbi:MAG: glycosyltransferase family 4 protein, partial [Thermomicrobiales bacterium]